MEQSLQQIAILDALLTNWEMIRLRMGAISPALQEQLNALGIRLQSATTAEDLAMIIDDLLDLTSGTPAEDYVNSLVARSDLGETKITRGGAFPTSGAAYSGAIPENAAISFGTTVTGVERVPIFFSTNRTPTTIPGNSFSGEFQRTLTYGVATVTVPASHTPGELERPAWWNLFADKADKNKYFTLSEVFALQQADFQSKLEAASHNSTSTELLIFLHGFNVTFEEAAMRAAQFVCDSKFSGVVVLFSWPSQGKLLGYSGDEERAISSGDVMAVFLSGLAGSPWSRVHLLAHSMGNRVMLLGLADNPRPKLPLGQLVFAAADVFVPMFEEKFVKLQAAGLLRATSYASKDDRALTISSHLHSGPRVGLVADEPYQTEHLESIDATSVDRGVLGHGYWSSVPALLGDLKDLLQFGHSPLERKLKSVGKYWTF